MIFDLDTLQTLIKYPGTSW